MTTIETIYVVLGAYAVLHLGINALMHRPRLKMVALGEDLLADDRVSDEMKDRINHLMDTSMSFKVSVLVFIAVLAATADLILGSEPGRPNHFRDKRTRRFSALYFASIFAANPIFGFLSIIFLLMGAFISLLVNVLRHNDVHLVDVEASIHRPLMSAAVAVRA